jgi:hypothetical protein
MICSRGGVLVAVVISEYLGFPCLGARCRPDYKFFPGDKRDHRMAGLLETRREEPVEGTFRAFRKTHFLDVLVANGGLFEFKAVDSLAGRPRA